MVAVDRITVKPYLCAVAYEFLLLFVAVVASLTEALDVALPEEQFVAPFVRGDVIGNELACVAG